jgi:hypothetical protein
MPINLSIYKLLAIIVALFLLVALSAFGGWHIRGWHDDSAQLKKANADIASLNAGFSTVVTASNQLAATISMKNQATEASIAGLTIALGDQDHALAQLRLDIKSIPVGTCSFTPDADGLYQRAYKTAFGDTSDPTSGSGKASIGHANHSAATAASRHQ